MGNQQDVGKKPSLNAFINFTNELTSTGAKSIKKLRSIGNEAERVQKKEKKIKEKEIEIEKDRKAGKPSGKKKSKHGFKSKRKFVFILFLLFQLFYFELLFCLTNLFFFL